MKVLKRMKKLITDEKEIVKEIKGVEIWHDCGGGMGSWTLWGAASGAMEGGGGGRCGVGADCCRVGGICSLGMARFFSWFVAVGVGGGIMLGC